MKIAIFDTHHFERETFDAANACHAYELTFVESRLTRHTAPLAMGFAVVCSFVNDRLDAESLTVLRAGGARLIALRSAGYNHVDLEAADRLELVVVRVPEYSPYAGVRPFAASPGEFVAREGERARAFYLIQSGRVEIGHTAAGDVFVPIADVGPGEVIGWSWVLPPHQWQFDYRAAEAVLRALPARLPRLPAEDARTRARTPVGRRDRRGRARWPLNRP